MIRIAVFPGQGAQAVGMGRALHDASPAARAVFAEVDDALGEPLSALIFEGSAERLRMTANAQPALMATSIAAVRAVEERMGRKLTDLVGYVAGHSLGEHTALAAAGAVSVADAARLLRLRGQAMQAEQARCIRDRDRTRGRQRRVLAQAVAGDVADQVRELASRPLLDRTHGRERGRHQRWLGIGSERQPVGRSLEDQRR